MRSAELTLAMRLLPVGGRILELGAGDGWQASILARHGFTVTALDVASTEAAATQYVPVTIYDGRTIPFPDGSFDAVFSSNVLEHVKDFDRIQAELARVLTTDGVAVHCVPSATWRLWTTLGHPFHAIRWVWNSRRRGTSQANQSQARPIAHQPRRRGVLGLMQLGLIAPKHGEHGNFVSEHFLFSRRSWKHRFEQTGWQISAIRLTGLFYSGNELFGLRLATQFRGWVAKMLGSSTCIFVLRPRPHRL
jgi:2-polyprenyl-3-methyl-5-hydroxy-6-metoxy-1,4-benzoquinol methylase